MNSGEKEQQAQSGDERRQSRHEGEDEEREERPRAWLAAGEPKVEIDPDREKERAQRDGRGGVERGARGRVPKPGMLESNVRGENKRADQPRGEAPRPVLFTRSAVVLYIGAK